MEARAWRVCAGAGAALLGLLALVAWRADALAGGWLLALRLTALLAVAGLLACVLLAGRAALHPPARREVVVRVPAAGSASATVRGAPGTARLQRLLALAVASAAPLLVVLALATAPRDPGASAGTAAPAPQDGQPAGGTGGTSGTDAPAAPTSPAPAPPAPSTAAPSEPAPSASAPPSSAAPTAPPSAVTAPDAVPDTAAAPGAACVQVVRAGDSLWRLAQAQLGPGATDAQVDARWRAVYARNAAAVGPDPDLVHPGLVLDACS